MNTLLRTLLAVAPFILSLTVVAGCGGEPPAPTPQQIEEMRQQQIRQSESFHNNK
jgi:hypothetical protein